MSSALSAFRRRLLNSSTGALAIPSIASLVRQKPPGLNNMRPHAKHVIHMWLPGGPTHIDMFDLKPSAPRHVVVPAMRESKGAICQLSSHLPELAKQMDKCEVVRGTTASQAADAAISTDTSSESIGVEGGDSGSGDGGDGGKDEGGDGDGDGEPPIQLLLLVLFILAAAIFCIVADYLPETVLNRLRYLLDIFSIHGGLGGLLRSLCSTSCITKNRHTSVLLSILGGALVSSHIPKFFPSLSPDQFAFFIGLIWLDVAIVFRSKMRRLAKLLI